MLSLILSAAHGAAKHLRTPRDPYKSPNKRYNHVREVKMTALVTLIRGINVGGKTVRMDALKELHQSLGLKNVATYIQSGNVVCTTDDPDIAQLPKHIEQAFAQKFGFQTSVMVRTAGEINAIIENNPFQNQPTKESKRVVVMFLSTLPVSTAQLDIQKTYTGP
jgi:uncharacterized protein (DUF1697 family)